MKTISLLAAMFLTAVLSGFALSPMARADDENLAEGNTAEGKGALSSVTTGINNTAIGFKALHSLAKGSEATATGSLALSNDRTGYNTAYGFSALYSNTTGIYNTATGRNALLSNTTGTNNTATGGAALVSNTTGTENTANGRNALFSNTTGIENTANGVSALFSNTEGNDNTANGVAALLSNTTGHYNTANGAGALGLNTTGQSNTANGYLVLLSNTTGTENTANGVSALSSNTTGSNNAANGSQALQNNTTGGNNIALGVFAGGSLTTGNNNIDIGNFGVNGESRTIRIGTKATHKNTFIAGIHGVTVAGGVEVMVDANGHLGTVTSSARFKDEIKPMDRASEAILALKPVTFRYKHELDPESIPQFGLVAEQVEKVNPDLVARDDQGKAYTVRYEAVNAMLLNEFLKEHRKVQQQEATINETKSAIAKQEGTNAQQQKQIEALTAGFEKVSEQLEVSRRAPQLVADNQ